MKPYLSIIQRKAEYLERLLPQTDPLLREVEAYGENQRTHADRRSLPLWITARHSSKAGLEMGMAIGYNHDTSCRAVGRWICRYIDPSDR